MTDPIEPPFQLTRDTIMSGVMRVAAINGGMRILTDEELAASRAAMLAGRAADEPVWVFGYGSLIWNPAFHFVEQRPGRVIGRHRQFCLWTHLGRGSPEQPGLTLALEPGGSCTGMAFRIAADVVATELEVVWRREMLSDAYAPRWVRVETAEGPVTAVAFTMNHRHPRYAGRLDDDTVARVLASASGRLGRCADYLFRTIEALDALNLSDRRLHALAAKVRQLGCCEEGGIATVAPLAAGLKS
ncbi:MAG TPA: gamma-glutamylcyclotransferase [Stellaceae bacterium]|nr:gamma-glutamylcyclotransferase [Stellaceae bacterium]